MLVYNKRGQHKEGWRVPEWRGITSYTKMERICKWRV